MDNASELEATLRTIDGVSKGYGFFAEMNFAFQLMMYRAGRIESAAACSLLGMAEDTFLKSGSKINKELEAGTCARLNDEVDQYARQGYPRSLARHHCIAFFKKTQEGHFIPEPTPDADIARWVDQSIEAVYPPYEEAQKKKEVNRAKKARQREQRRGSYKGGELREAREEKNRMELRSRMAKSEREHEEALARWKSRQEQHVPAASEFPPLPAAVAAKPMATEEAEETMAKAKEEVSSTWLEATTKKETTAAVLSSSSTLEDDLHDIAAALGGHVGRGRKSGKKNGGKKK